jgi:hypothetical protein
MACLLAQSGAARAHYFMGIRAAEVDQDIFLAISASNILVFSGLASVAFGLLHVQATQLLAGARGFDDKVARVVAHARRALARMHPRQTGTAVVSGGSDAEALAHAFGMGCRCNGQSTHGEQGGGCGTEELALVHLKLLIEMMERWCSQLVCCGPHIGAG